MGWRIHDLEKDVKKLLEENRELKLALIPFAKMHRPGCDLSQLAAQRGIASDTTILTSRDFSNAAEALGISPNDEDYEDSYNDLPEKIYDLEEELKKELGML